MWWNYAQVVIAATLMCAGMLCAAYHVGVIGEAQMQGVWHSAADLPCGGAWVGQEGYASNNEMVWPHVKLIGFEHTDRDYFICELIDADDAGVVKRFRHFMPDSGDDAPPAALAARVSRLELLVEGLRQMHRDDGR